MPAIGPRFLFRSFADCEILALVERDGADSGIRRREGPLRSEKSDLSARKKVTHLLSFADPSGGYTNRSSSRCSKTTSHILNRPSRCDLHADDTLMGLRGHLAAAPPHDGLPGPSTSHARAAFDPMRVNPTSRSSPVREPAQPTPSRSHTTEARVVVSILLIPRDASYPDRRGCAARACKPPTGQRDPRVKGLNGGMAEGGQMFLSKVCRWRRCAASCLEAGVASSGRASGHE